MVEIINILLSLSKMDYSGDGGDDPVPKLAPELKPLELTDPGAGLILSLLPATHSQTYYSPPAHIHTGAKANGFALQNYQNDCTTEAHIYAPGGRAGNSFCGLPVASLPL